MKKICFYLFLALCMVLTLGCDVVERKPLTVTFTDVSGALSTDHTVKISFAEEKDYEDYFIDILVKSDTDVELTIFQELSKDEDKVKLSLTANGGYISLDEYKLFNLEKEQTDSMVGYGDVLMTTLVINASNDANLTLLAVIGEKDGENFKQLGAVSNEYILNVKKHINAR